MILGDILTLHFEGNQLYLDTGIEKLTASITNFKEGAIKVLIKLVIFIEYATTSENTLEL